jgi:hypothetical protein
MATSQRPDATSLAACPMLWAPAAHAVVTVSDGPCHPRRMEMAAAPALDIIMGTSRGETRRGPFSPKIRIWVSSVSRPPTRAHHNARAPGVGIDLAGVLEGHGRHSHGELGEPIELAGFFAGDPALGVEIGDPTLADGRRPVEPGPQRFSAHAAT